MAEPTPPSSCTCDLPVALAFFGPCPQHPFDRLNTSLLAAPWVPFNDLSLLGDLPPPSVPRITERMSWPQYDPDVTIKPFKFLELCGGIRNKIYRLVLVKQGLFRVQADRYRFFPVEASPVTALLCVSKQVHQETSTIFYQENTFLIPFSVFGEEYILPSLNTTYHLPPKILMALKHIEIHITILRPGEQEYINQRNALLARLEQNVKSLSYFLWKNCSDRLAIRIVICPEEGGSELMSFPRDYKHAWAPWVLLRSRVARQQGSFEIVVRTGSTYTIDWFLTLSPQFGKNWRIIASLRCPYAHAEFLAIMEKLNCKQYFDQKTENETYEIWPRRDAPEYLFPTYL